MSSRNEIPPMALQVKLMIGGIIALMILIAVVSLWPKKKENFDIFENNCPPGLVYDPDKRRCVYDTSKKDRRYMILYCIENYNIIIL